MDYRFGWEIRNSQWRFQGELASLPVRWNIDASDITAPVEAQGLFRRLRQGERLVESPYRRGVLLDPTSVVQYWPMEEEGTTLLPRFGAAIGTNAFIITGVPNPSSNNDFVSSAALPTLANDSWLVNVDSYTAAGVWQLRWMMSVPEGNGNTDVDFLRITTTDITWDIRNTDSNLQVLAYRGGSTSTPQVPSTSTSRESQSG